MVLFLPKMTIQIAWRYFKGKKSTQAIQLISWVSIVAMAVGTAALLIVLSVFNGFEGFIKSLYSDFYPMIKITAERGKHFEPDSTLIFQLSNMNGVKEVSQTLEGKVLLTNDVRQTIVTMKGIDRAYEQVTGMSGKVRYGVMDFTKSADVPPIVLGIGVANKLGASEETHLPISAYTFTHGSTNLLNPSSGYQSMLFQVSGVYVLQEEIDNQYVFAPLNMVGELLGKQGKLSSIELSLNKEADAGRIKEKLGTLLTAKSLKAETRYEQNKTFYFILRNERWAVFAILTLMLIIASFNIVGCMSMLVIDKEKDIAILQAMGMTKSRLSMVFVQTGILLSVVGGLIGMVLAIIICLAQQQFGFVKLGGEGSFLIDAYPVKLQWTDFLLVFTTVVIIAFLASLWPSVKATQRPISLRSR